MSKLKKIVVVEDETDILELLSYNLQKEGFRVVCVRDGEQALQTIQKENPELILLDLMLPGVDGLEVCRRVRQDPTTRNIPIIMVTAKGEESDIVAGLSIGADDYIPKPFSPRELVARVKAVLRRGVWKEGQPTAGRLERGDLTIDAEKFEAKVKGTTLILTATEFRLLQFLATHPGRVFTREQLLNRVIGESAIVTDRNIDVHIQSVRKKMGTCRDMIETIRGIGYRFKE